MARRQRRRSRRRRRRRRRATREPASPVRTCVGCRRRAPAPELVRLRRTVDGEVAIGAGPGRGAWLCAPPGGIDCLEQALRRGALSRALRTSLRNDAGARLRARLEGRRDA